MNITADFKATPNVHVALYLLSWPGNHHIITPIPFIAAILSDVA